VLLGGGELDTGHHPGIRVTASGAAGNLGLEGSFFYIARRSTSRSVSSTGQLGSTDLLLPYRDANAGGVESTTEISLSPSYGGSAREELKNELMGAELDGAFAFFSQAGIRAEILGGVRWMRLRETYTITTSSAFIAPTPTDVWDTTDRFDASNNFYGLQLGARARFDRGPFHADASLRLAGGAMRQSVDVDGFLVTNDFSLAPVVQPGQPAQYGPTETFAGGYFALPSNIGSHARTVFAIVPELRVNVGFKVAPGLTVFAGYTFLYANKVARPGRQIDRNINTTQNVAWVGDIDVHPTGPSAPGFEFDSSSFRAQGVNVGVAFGF
jgi:hypothetical protein